MSDFIGKIKRNCNFSYGIWCFVEISENGCEGLVRPSEINGDTFIADVNNYCIKGFNTGEVIRLGEVRGSVKC
jgi:exoribonuclease R